MARQRNLIPSLFFEIDELHNAVRNSRSDRNFQASGMEANLSVYEDESHVYVEAPVPGLNEDEIDITFEKGVLWINGQKESEEKDESKKYHLKSSKSFSYCLNIPGHLDQQAIPKASCDKGILHISFAKSELAKPRKIEIEKK